MDKYKTNSAFNKWFSAINLNGLPLSMQEKISDFNRYQKKLTFTKALQIFLHGIHEEKESLREMDTAFVSDHLQKEIGLKNISYSQLSRKMVALDEEVLCAIFSQLLGKVRAKTSPNKRNSLYLVDSSTFSLNKRYYPWAEFRKTTSGVKLHMKLCFMDNENWFPEDFKITNAVEHDDNHLEIFLDHPEATYVFDRGYLNYERMDDMHDAGYFFVTRVKKNSVIHVLDSFEVPENSNILSDQFVAVGRQNYLTSRFRLVVVEDKHGNPLRIVTNRHDLNAQEIAEAYKSRWQIELFFKYIKQHLTIKKFFSKSETGVKNQLILAMITVLLTYLIKLETGATQTLFQIKRLFRVLLFEPADKWLALLRPK